MPREVSLTVKNAVAMLFAARASMVEERLRRASAFERAHQDILAFSLGDEAKLDELCALCEEDDRNVYILEDRPEECFVGVPRKDDAAAELARRFELLGFPVPSRFAGWGQYSKHWKAEWSVASSE